MKPILALTIMFVAPTFAIAAPTTQPVKARECAVEVKEFAPLLGAKAQAEIGAAVQENLVAALARAHFHPIANNGTARGDYAVAGSFQAVGDQLRFTAEITETRSGNVVGGLSATGTANDLFSLEDTLSHQTIQQLHRLTSPPIPVVADATLAQMIQPIPPSYAVDQRALLISELNRHQTVANDYQYQYSASRDNQTYGFGQTDAYGYGYGYGYGIPFVGYSNGRRFYSNAWFGGRHLPLR